MSSRSFIIAIMLFVLAIPSMTQTDPVSPRYALVIGNGEYDELGKLSNPGFGSRKP